MLSGLEFERIDDDSGVVTLSDGRQIPVCRVQRWSASDDGELFVSDDVRGVAQVQNLHGVNVVIGDVELSGNANLDCSVIVAVDGNSLHAQHSSFTNSTVVIEGYGESAISGTRVIDSIIAGGLNVVTPEFRRCTAIGSASSIASVLHYVDIDGDPTFRGAAFKQSDFDGRRSKVTGSPQIAYLAATDWVEIHGDVVFEGGDEFGSGTSAAARSVISGSCRLREVNMGGSSVSGDAELVRSVLAYSHVAGAARVEGSHVSRSVVSDWAHLLGAVVRYSTVAGFVHVDGIELGDEMALSEVFASGHCRIEGGASAQTSSLAGAVILRVESRVDGSRLDGQVTVIDQAHVGDSVIVDRETIDSDVFDRRDDLDSSGEPRYPCEAPT